MKYVLFFFSAYVNQLANESKQTAISKLLAHLPLLHANNQSAKNEYLKLISNVLNYTIQNGQNIEESRQIISYSLMHPAFTSEERSDYFTLWIGKLEEQFTYRIGNTNSGQKVKPESLTDSFDKLSVHSPPIHYTNGHHKPVSSSTQNGWHTSPSLDHHQINQELDLLTISTDHAHLLNQHNQLNHHLSNLSPLAHNHGDVDHHPKCHNGHMPLMSTKSAPVVPPSQISSKYRVIVIVW